MMVDFAFGCSADGISEYSLVLDYCDFVVDKQEMETFTNVVKFNPHLNNEC